ncbi:UDP-N-acetylglucosamine 1-carboxyvinyltransferase [Verrucomicrobium sp. GAS474]|uniref:UDP-N-acetylglucosamine 1-carboxyvinyltransferase n=1 Tax=Verrucomicrobium sp. GAS474 TaxID=1882831 RepID=UPI0008795D6F|nr:UDP-N-acetylglucosamine 1-carboxyvinyltransferase [Verrucomicrobium sp. GAS474]SDU19384.1 UDP-N-acetylglucosamine 1-carboxyvinyltransferase [Verrucomicrobium sp. GAS474]
MDKFIVKGGTPLQGKIQISGSKNSALPILAATLLTPETCIIHRVPDLSDIRYMLEILKHLGAEVEFKNGTVTVRAEKIHAQTPYDLVRKMRASICVLGPLVARFGQAKISLPGGCVIGDRPIDIHLRGIEALGGHVETEEGNVIVTSKKLVGTEIPLGGKFGSTVLGTDNVMMAATAAEGTTVIESAACEPEVTDLAEFLISMGAKISGVGSTRIEITGGTPLHGTEYTVIPDRIEAGTFAIAGLITGGDVTLEGTNNTHLANVLFHLKHAGAVLDKGENSLRVRTNGPLRPLDLVTEVYPGFPTDMQAQFCALLSVVPGNSVITEKIFPNRYMHLPELKRMGANIDLEGSTAILRGVSHLSAAPVMASDLRASAALVIAGLAAKGSTEVNRVYHIDRGYEKIDEKLRAVGADIQRRPGS